MYIFQTFFFVSTAKDASFSPRSVAYSLCVLVQINLISLSLSFLICKIEVIKRSTY